MARQRVIFTHNSYVQDYYNHAAISAQSKLNDGDRGLVLDSQSVSEINGQGGSIPEDWNIFRHGDTPTEIRTHIESLWPGVFELVNEVNELMTSDNEGDEGSQPEYSFFLITCPRRGSGGTIKAHRYPGQGYNYDSVKSALNSGNLIIGLYICQPQAC